MKIFLAALLLVALSLAQARAADIGPALANTFGHEGGFQRNPDDTGNYVNGVNIGTKFGIAAASYPHEDIQHLTLKRAAEIYQSDFWGASRCNDWDNQIVAEMYFDFAVNIGQKTAARMIQRAVNYAGYPLPPIPVDGKIGRATVQRLNQVNQTMLFVHLVGLGHGRYVQIVDANKHQMPNMASWAIRIKKNVQRSVHEYEALRGGK